MGRHPVLIYVLTRTQISDTGRRPVLVSVLKVGPILVIHTVCSLFNLIRQKVNNINLSYSEKIMHSHKECFRTAINFKIKSL